MSAGTALVGAGSAEQVGVGWQRRTAAGCCEGPCRAPGRGTLVSQWAYGPGTARSGDEPASGHPGPGSLCLPPSAATSTVGSVCAPVFQSLGLTMIRLHAVGAGHRTRVSRAP